MSHAPRIYKIIALSPWLHLAFFWSLVARLYATLGRFPVYGEPASTNNEFGLNLHLLLTGLTAPLFWIPPVWFIPVAGVFHVVAPHDQKRTLWSYTLFFVAGYAQILYLELGNPWGLGEWFLD